MLETVEIKYFTVGDLKAWLFRGDGPKGLGEEVIARQRAYAVVSSPAAEDSMEVVSAIFVNDVVAGFAAVYPERLSKPNNHLVFWFTTLYCKPEFRGRGYGAMLLAYLYEAHTGQILDVAAVDETNEGLKFLNYEVGWFSQYEIVLRKRINKVGVRGHAAFFVESLKCAMRRKHKQDLLKDCVKQGYLVEYSTFVDDQTWEFMEKHSSDDMFLRSRETFNWILSFPFICPAPALECVGVQNSFPSQVQAFQYFFAKVSVDGLLVGCFIFRVSNGEFALKYIYYDSKYRETVFRAVLANILKLNADRVITNDKGLFDFILDKRIQSKSRKYDVSFAHPSCFDLDAGLAIQAGDGDMLT